MTEQDGRMMMTEGRRDDDRARRHVMMTEGRRDDDRARRQDDDDRREEGR